MDRILGQEPLLAPSSDFAARVMRAVHRQATAPPPLAFPWSRALPGLGACLAATAGAVLAAASDPGADGPLWAAEVERLVREPAVVWLGLTLLGSYLLSRTALALAGGRP